MEPTENRGQVPDVPVSQEDGRGAARKMLDVLRYVPGHPDGVPLNVMARELNLSPSTVFRLAQTAVQAGFLEQGTDKHYRIGPHLRALALRVAGAVELRRVAHPMLLELRQHCGETVHLSVLERGQVVDVDAVESDHPIKVSSPVGRNLPIHCTSTGKVLLAYRPLTEATVLLQVTEMRRFTNQTKTTAAELLPELAAIRERGWAMDNEEHERSVVCVAAPIIDALGNVCAAVGISGLKWNMESHGVDILTRQVQATAFSISQALGAGQHMLILLQRASST